MNDPNKRNLQYFENASMKGLYGDMEVWQGINQKRLLSASIQKDGDMFCCVALSNPMEVAIQGHDTVTGQLASVQVTAGRLHTC